MLWPIVSAVAVAVAAALVLGRKGPLKKASLFVLSVLLFAGAAGGNVLTEYVLGSFSQVSDDRKVWHILAGLVGLAVAAFLAGGIAFIGLFVKAELGGDTEKKA